MRRPFFNFQFSIFNFVILTTALHAQVITIDANADRHPISPLIYGVAFATPQQLSELHAPLNRSGGNAESRYNWQANASNRAADWYFESLAYDSATAGAEADRFIADTKSAGAEPMITIGAMGWVARLGNNRQRLSSFSIAKYGAQQDRDWQWFPDAGNGTRAADGKPITGNDPNDANLRVDALFQQAWVREHLAPRGVHWYFIDNEPSLWHATHRDVHPDGATMEEIRDRTIDHASRIKDVDPTALVCGPEEWGWLGFLYSGADQQYAASRNDWSRFPDREAHGNVDMVPWLLSELRKSDRRLLDVLTVHWYPQSGEFSEDTSPRAQGLRNRSTRSLWDASYTDESWIGAKVALIPRLKQWASTNPGTRIGITEYNWGAEHSMNGATAQADVLGIFGREGLDLATRWTTPARDTPAYNAMVLYRSFGTTSISCAAPDPDHVSAFAAVRADGALTVMIVAKDIPATVSLKIAGFAGGTAKVSQLTASGIAARPDVSGPTYTLTVPQASVTLVVIPARVVGRRRAAG